MVATTTITLLLSACTKAVAVDDTAGMLSMGALHRDLEEDAGMLNVDMRQKRSVSLAQLQSSEASFAELAASAASASVPESTKKSAHEFKKFVTEVVRNDIMAADDEDRKHLARNVEAVSKCITDYQKESADNVAVHTQWTESKKQHTDCRGELKKQEEAMAGDCGDLSNYIAELEAMSLDSAPATANFLFDNGNPSCANIEVQGTEAIGAYFEKLLETIKHKQGAWDAKTKSCTKEAEATKIKKASCDALQIQFETKFCSWRHNALDDCYGQQVCHGETVDQFEAAKETVTLGVSHRKKMLHATGRINCYLDFILEADSAKSFEQCKDVTVDDSKLNIKVDLDLAEQENCQLSQYIPFPGHAEWVNGYSDLECQAGGDHQCDEIKDEIMTALKLA